MESETDDNDEHGKALTKLPKTSMPQFWKPPPSIPGLFAAPEEDADCVPTDHTLPEFLMKVSGSSDLSAVKKLRLRLPPRHSSLTRVSAYLPALISLTLDSSSIGTLRHLGLGLVNLRELSVVRCGLESLDGLFGLPILRRLWAGFNQIDDVASLTALRKLRSADLRSNMVCDVEYVGFLHICCPRLTELVLADNPCADDAEYRTRVRALLPRLILLDESPLPEFTDVIPSPESRDLVPDDDDVEEEEEDEDDDDDDESCRSQSYFSDETTRAERLWSNSDSQPPNPEPQSRSHKPSTARSYDVGPLAPVPQVAKSAPYPWVNASTEEGSASTLTSGGIVCGNLSTALRNRSRRGARVQDSSSGSGDFKRTSPVDKTGSPKKQPIVKRKGV